MTVVPRYELAFTYDYRRYTKLSHKELQTRLANDEETSNALYSEVNNRLEENKALIVAGNTIAAKITETLKLDWLHKLGSELKDFVRKIFVVNVKTYTAVLNIQSCLPS